MAPMDGWLYRLCTIGYVSMKLSGGGARCSCLLTGWEFWAGKARVPLIVPIYNYQNVRVQSTIGSSFFLPFLYCF